MWRLNKIIYAQWLAQYLPYKCLINDSCWLLVVVVIVSIVEVVEEDTTTSKLENENWNYKEWNFWTSTLRSNFDWSSDFRRNTGGLDKMQITGPHAHSSWLSRSEWGGEFAFLTCSQVVLMLVFPRLHFENYWLEDWVKGEKPALRLTEIEVNGELGESSEKVREVAVWRLCRSTSVLSSSIGLITFLFLSSPEFGIMLGT